MPTDNRFEAATLSFRAKRATVEKLDALMAATGLSRSALIALLVDRAELKSTKAYTIKPIALDDEAKE